MQDVMTGIGHVASIVTVVGSIFTFFLGISGFHVPRFLVSKVSGERKPNVTDDIRPEVVEKMPVNLSKYVRYSVSEVVVVTLENRPLLRQNAIEALWLFGPSLIAVILTLLPVPPLLSSTFLLITIFWVLFLFSEIMPLASVRTPTEILFTDNIVEIFSPVPINDELLNNLRLDRDDVRFGTGYIPGRTKMLDRLTLYFQCEENYANLIMVPRWYANLRKYPSLEPIAASLNKITRNDAARKPEA